MLTQGDPRRSTLFTILIVRYHPLHKRCSNQRLVLEKKIYFGTNTDHRYRRAETFRFSHQIFRPMPASVQNQSIRFSEKQKFLDMQFREKQKSRARLGKKSEFEEKARFETKLVNDVLSTSDRFSLWALVSRKRQFQSFSKRWLQEICLSQPHLTTAEGKR